MAVFKEKGDATGGHQTPKQRATRVAVYSPNSPSLLNEDLMDPLLAAGQSPELEPLESTLMELGPYAAITPISETIPISSMPGSGTVDDSMALFTNWPSSEIIPPAHHWLANFNQGSVFERPSSPADNVNTMNFEKMSDFCENIDPYHLHDSKAPLYYVVKRIKAFTSEIADRNAAPFLHRYLYKDHVPQCILSCFSVSVLYTKQTSENKVMVMRALLNNVQDLLNTEINRIMPAPIERLARTQVLFMYLIILLFDGDIFLRAQGEKHVPLLKTWLSDLCEMRDNLEDLAELKINDRRKQPPEDWKRWIFSESLRRTIVMAYSVMGLYELMKDPEGEGDSDPWTCSHRWTLSRHLWNSESTSEFNRIWKEKPYFIITNYDFDEFLKDGSGEDVDDFAALLLSAYIGVDRTKDFISSDGLE